MQIPPCKWDCTVRARDKQGKEVVIYVEGVEAGTINEAKSKAGANIVKLGLEVADVEAEYSSKQTRVQKALPLPPPPPVLQQDLFTNEFFTKNTERTQFAKEES